MNVKHKQLHSLQYDRGAASIFIVVFFALLLGVIVVSFTRIAIQDQQQSTISDLNRSAYDSAEAGIEDAIRVLNTYNNECVKVAGPDPKCNKTTGSYKTLTDNPQIGNCNLHTLPGIAPKANTKGEVAITTSGNDDALNQAYTCVRMTINTPDVKINAEQDKSYLVPLLSTSGDITSVKVNWHDATTDGNNPPFKTFPELSQGNTWGNAPALLRVQLISVPKSNINIDSLSQNASSVFLFPSTRPLAVNMISMSAANATVGGEKITAPHEAKCSSSSVAYLCGVELNTFVGPAADYTYYLRITPLYRSTSFQIILNPGSDTLFNNVQPEIDSTGRANNVFRRIQQRVQYEAPTLENFTINGTFDITDGFCKDFNVANNPTDYTHNCGDSKYIEP